MSGYEDGFVQDYDLGKRQELWLYCRLCRRTFPVVFRPTTPAVKLKCLCGHEGPLSELDVFRDEAASREHAAFYERIYRAAKDALKDAGIPMPPSGKYRRVEDAADDSSFESYFHELDDASALADAYVEREESDVTEVGLRAGLREFDRRLERATDPLERHEVLSELVEWTYVRRHLDERTLRRFLEACREDIALAERVTEEARVRKRRGEKVRVSFSSFKHLLRHLEEDDQLEDALEVAEQAAALGLKGYADRAARLRAELDTA